MEQVKVYKEERVSRKTGEVYEVLIINFNGYSKVVFMNDAEKVVFRSLPFSKKVD